uniref:RNase H type-1 domain-containing protein n=1 Tax=Cannabis sativa TaxID=3483 RepID=A0A803QSA0_CANSA
MLSSVAVLLRHVGRMLNRPSILLAIPLLDKQNLFSLALETNGSKAEQWTKPVPNTIKINVDGASFENEGSYGFGIVARDSSGTLVGPVAVCKNGAFAAEVVEAIGVKEALSWLKDKSWDKVEMETDNMLTVQAIRASHRVSSVFGLVVNDCKLLLSNLPYVSLHFIRRSANRIAHYVARHSRFLSGCSIHIQNIPPDLPDLLYSKC